MEQYTGKTFAKISTIAKGYYADCLFEDAILPNSDFSGMRFENCSFIRCDLSSANLTNTAFQEVQFKDCKLLGMPFDRCSAFLFSVAFRNCVLNYSVFFKRKMKQTSFMDCALKECDFSGAELQESSFVGCDLDLSRFDQSNLEKCDFSEARNYDIDPEINKIKGARFASQELHGLLRKYGIIVS
jgi:uncharacterized protein YjbI with pentapeptide repeats